MRTLPAVFVTFLLFAGCGAVEPVVINELMPSNLLTIEDPAGGTADWVELYNPAAVEQSLEGWTISDDPTQPGRHTFPVGVFIDPGEYLVLWADGDPTLGSLHLGFRLSAAGEELALYEPSADGPVVRTSVEWPAIEPDIALARVEDGGEEWAQTDAGTPGAPN